MASFEERASQADTPAGAETSGYARAQAETLKTAARAIVALMLREMSTRFSRTPGGYLWMVVQPVAIIVVLAVGYSLLFRTPPLGTSFLLFKATGMLILLKFRQLTQVIGMSLNFSRPLLYFPDVRWIDAVLARFLLNAIFLLLVAWIVLQGILFYEGLILILRWNYILRAFGLSLLLSFGVGVLNTVLFMRFEVWQQFWNIFTAPLFIISGVIILYEDMPPIAQKILWWNPLLHITGLMRAGFYSTYNPDYLSITFVLFCALIPAVFGLLLLRRYHRLLLER